MFFEVVTLHYSHGNLGRTTVPPVYLSPLLLCVIRKAAHSDIESLFFLLCSSYECFASCSGSHGPLNHCRTRNIAVVYVSKKTTFFGSPSKENGLETYKFRPHLAALYPHLKTGTVMYDCWFVTEFRRRRRWIISCRLMCQFIHIYD